MTLHSNKLVLLVDDDDDNKDNIIKTNYKKKWWWWSPSCSLFSEIPYALITQNHYSLQVQEYINV